MPGPGPHLVYTLTVGTALLHISKGSFSPHHCLVYSLNAFLGPDVGSFCEWLTSNVGLGKGLGSFLMDFVHHPFYYVLLLGFPLSVLYSWLSKVALNKGWLDAFNGVPLSRKQCFFLVSAGSLSHFFLDHLFEENGRSRMYTWIISTGWWEGHAPNNPDAVTVVGLLVIILLGGFIYINRLNSGKSYRARARETMKLISIIVVLYSIWCASQIYLRKPPQPAIGEEADLGVFVFLTIYFFLPHSLCIASMHDKDHLETSELLPL